MLVKGGAWRYFSVQDASNKTGDYCNEVVHVVAARPPALGIASIGSNLDVGSKATVVIALYIAESNKHTAAGYL
jgi:hypothetical protein